MKIYDCFTYYNESDLVRIRFEELKNIVDYHVVVEADQTFTGRKKDFYFNNLPSWVEEYEDKILRVKISFPKKKMTSWKREFFQRNSISDYLLNLDLEDDDIVIISDADEIPRASIVSKLKDYPLPTRLDVAQYFWNFHWRVPDHCNQGARPIACRFIDLKQYNAQDLRSNTKEIISNAGWHFSFLGEFEKIKNKIESFAHTEYDSPEYKDAEKILHRIANGIDPFDRFPLKYYEIDETYPLYIQQVD